MRIAAILCFGLLPPAWAQVSRVQSIAAEMRTNGLDPAECYRVRDLHFTRGDDLRFYLTDGYLIFGKPVAGRPIAAVFSADTEGGDAEVLVLPPSKGERISLAAFTGAPNLDEHFSSGLFLFTDDTADVLKKAIAGQEDARKSPERGALLAAEWDRVLTNLSGSFSVRLVQHLMEGVPPERGIFYSALQGVKLGNFDAIYDPEASDQIYLGQLKHSEKGAFYDTWTSFQARAFRKALRKADPYPLTMADYRIHALLDNDLHLKVATTATVTAAREMKVLPFEISEGMKVTSVRLNGDECELFTSESFRANLLRRSGSTLFVVLPPRPLEAGRPYEVLFEHEGDVVRPAGRDVYFVGSRSNWYPRSGAAYAKFDITFRYPGHLDLVFPGELKEEGKDGEYRVARRVTQAPIRLAGFNLGKYEKASVERGELAVNVYANRQSEFAVRVPGSEVVVLPQRSGFPQRRGPQPAATTIIPPARYFPDPTSRLQSMGSEIAGAFEFLAKNLGPPALPVLMVSPIPGTFGQGFPGLVYLSTIAYLDPAERPQDARAVEKQLFFSEILYAHEVAHQWWGNVVTVGSASDEWLMEALANYTALVLLEKKKGAREARQILAEYREKLLSRDDTGKTQESAGPLRLGTRLSSSQAPEAWHHIVYGKGSWVMHMLRMRMGDAAFWKLLGQIAAEHRNQTLTTQQFRSTAAAYLPKGAADPFFEHWVESTGIPTLTLAHRWRAGKLSMTVTQTGVDDDVSVQVPVEVLVRGGKRQMHWITTGEEPVTLTVAMRAPPLKVTLDPDGAVLRQ